MPLKPKKIPLRKCLACQGRFPKQDLVRVVKSKEGLITLDKTGKANGRGAYICNKKECLEKAFKRRAFERALECNISQELKDGLLEAIDE